MLACACLCTCGCKYARRDTSGLDAGLSLPVCLAWPGLACPALSCPVLHRAEHICAPLCVHDGSITLRWWRGSESTCTLTFVLCHVCLLLQPPIASTQIQHSGQCYLLDSLLWAHVVKAPVSLLNMRIDRWCDIRMHHVQKHREDTQ